VFVMGSGWNKSCVGINDGVYYVIPWFGGFEGLVVCAVSAGERVRTAHITKPSNPPNYGIT